MISAAHVTTPTSRLTRLVLWWPSRLTACFMFRCVTPCSSYGDGVSLRGWRWFACNPAECRPCSPIPLLSRRGRRHPPIRAARQDQLEVLASIQASQLRATHPVPGAGSVPSRLIRFPPADLRHVHRQYRTNADIGWPAGGWYGHRRSYVPRGPDFTRAAARACRPGLAGARRGCQCRTGASWKALRTVRTDHRGTASARVPARLAHT